MKLLCFKQNIQKATVLRKKYANAKLTYY